MSRVTEGRETGVTPGPRRCVQTQATGAAIAQGAGILTLDGSLPVEYLNPGDLIVTRAGAMRLLAVHVHLADTPLIRVAPSSLGHDRPGHPLLLAPETEVLVRDWRAPVMFGRAQAMVAVARLVDGDYVTRVAGEGVRLFTLEFANPQVICADGVEVGCAAVAADVATKAAA